MLLSRCSTEHNMQAQVTSRYSEIWSRSWNSSSSGLAGKSGSFSFRASTCNIHHSPKMRTHWAIRQKGFIAHYRQKYITASEKKSIVLNKAYESYGYKPTILKLQFKYLLYTAHSHNSRNATSMPLPLTAGHNPTLNDTLLVDIQVQHEKKSSYYSNEEVKQWPKYQTLTTCF